MEIADPRVQENITEMACFLAKTKDEKLINDFLHCLLTPSEIADVAGRWALVKAIKEKKTQREIARSLGISLCKITRGSREYKKPDSAFRKIFNDTGDK